MRPSVPALALLVVLVPACAATRAPQSSIDAGASTGERSFDRAPSTPQPAVAQPVPLFAAERALFAPADPPFAPPTITGAPSPSTPMLAPVIGIEPVRASPLGPAELLEKMPILLAGSRYIVAPDEDSVSALLLRTTDEKVVTKIPTESFGELESRLDRSESLIRMQNATTEFDPNGYPIAAFSHAGLRVVFREPNLLVFDEKTGATVYRKRPAWWSVPGALAPANAASSPDEFRCPVPATILQDAWVSSDHKIMLLHTHRVQFMCICGEGGPGEWHTLEMPFAPAPVDPPSEG